MYAEMDSVEAGLKFKTRAGLVVETTGVSQQIENHEVHVHEVVIVEGEGQGEKYLHNLDFAEKV
jgi:DNA topoisomerase VI subunit A